MQKQILFIATIAIIMTLSSGCANVDTNTYLPTETDTITEQHIEAIYATVPEASFKHTESLSEQIVTGSLSNDGALFDVPGGTKGTITTFSITSVLSGDLNVGDTICLLEPYWYTRVGENKVILNHFGPYGPTALGKEYLFFLRTSNSERIPEGTFLPATDSFSRFPVPEKKPGAQAFSDEAAPTEEQFNIIDTYDFSSFEDYLEMYEEALEKYLLTKSS